MNFLILSPSPFSAAKRVHKVLGLLEAKMLVKPEVGLIGVHYKHLVSSCGHLPGHQSRYRALSASTFAANNNFHLYSSKKTPKKNPQPQIKLRLITIFF